MYEQYSSTHSSKPSNANKTFADSMKAGGGGTNLSGSGSSAMEGLMRSQREQTQKDNDSKPDEDVGGVKSFLENAWSWLSASGGEPEKPKVYDGSSIYSRPEFDPSRYTKPINFSEQDKRIDDMLYNRDDDPGYKDDEYAGSTYDEVKEQEGVEEYRSTKARAEGINNAIKGIMDTEQRQDDIRNAVNKTIDSLRSADPTVDYVIQAGDTLSSIAAKTGTTVEDLVKVNNIEDKNKIFTGNDLIIPTDKTTKTKEDIVSTLIKGYERKKDMSGTQVASSDEIRSDAKMQQTGAVTYETADDMSELEILARTIEAEASGESKKGKLAVGAVIANRADQNRFGNDIRSVILFPSQFSPWNTYTDSEGGEQGKDMLGEKMKPSKDSYDAAKKILSGDYVDPTFGASHFVNPKISKPDWYDGFKDNGTTKIGKHEFGDADKMLLSPRPKARPLGRP